MSFDFEDAAPVAKPFSGGKTAEPNPFTDIIATIALRTYSADDPMVLNGQAREGDPVAKTFDMAHTIPDGENPDDQIRKDRGKIIRQTHNAGKNNDPVVTVRTHFADANDIVKSGPNEGKVRAYKTRVTFWTTKPYKTKTRTTTTADENTTEDTTTE